MIDSSLISCPHCGKQLEVTFAPYEQRLQCAYCQGVMTLPPHPVQPIAPPIFPQIISSAPQQTSQRQFDIVANPSPSNSLNLDLVSQRSISVHLEGMYRGRYLMNNKKVLVKFTDAAFEASTYSVSILVMILLLVALTVVIIGGIIAAFILLGIGSGETLLEDLPAMMIVKFGGPPVLLLLVFSMFYFGTKLGRKENIRVDKKQITRVRKGMGKVGDFAVIIDINGGRFNLTVPKEKESQLRQFVLENTGKRVN